MIENWSKNWKLKNIFCPIDRFLINFSALCFFTRFHISWRCFQRSIIQNRSKTVILIKNRSIEKIDISSRDTRLPFQKSDPSKCLESCKSEVIALLYICVVAVCSHEKFSSSFNKNLLISKNSCFGHRMHTLHQK